MKTMCVLGALTFVGLTIGDMTAIVMMILAILTIYMVHREGVQKILISRRSEVRE